ncbi:MAG: erythromycin esterase family protein [Stackebrandtia sp.]
MNSADSATSTRLSEAAINPLTTLDPAASLDDLSWLDAAIGDARVVAIGESAHYNREFYLLRHRLLRYLVERHGFGAYAVESGFIEGRHTDGWIHGDGDSERLSEVMADGITSLMGLWTPVRAHLDWMRRHNSTATSPIRWYGIDMPGSNVSLLPGLDAVTAYLETAEPGFQLDPGIRELAGNLAAPSAFSQQQTFTGYVQLDGERRDALTAGLADIAARMTSRRLDYLRHTTVDDYERSLRALLVTVALDAMYRRLARGDQRGMMMTREAGIAGTVEWILQREDRVVLVAHNAHVQRSPGSLPGMDAAITMGMNVADRLGGQYLAIGTTTGSGRTLNTGADFFAGQLFTDLQTPQPGSLDALMTASHDAPFATDLRRLSSADAELVRATTEHRMGNVYCEAAPLDAFDIVVHIPHVTAAEPDEAAVARSPADVRAAFGNWSGR